MPPRYFEIIITGRQLAALVVGVAAAIAVAFALGLGVRLLQPPAAPQEAASIAAVAPTPPGQPTPPAFPTAVPAAAPVAAPVPTNTPLPAAAEPTKTVPPPGPVAPRSGRWVQVAALGSRRQAEGARNRVVALGFIPKQVVVEPAEGKFRVRVGPFPDVESAGRVAARLRAEGFGGSFVVKPGE